MTPSEALAAWCESPAALVAVLPAAALVALLATWAAGRLCDAPAGEHTPVPVVTWVAFVTAMTALWWWELPHRGLDVASTDGLTAGLRYAGHVMLMGLLLAAARVDLRERVIPDAITAPGMLAGLIWNASFPDTLPPIGLVVERSWAPPLVEPDSLGATGGIAAGLPAWLGPGSVLGLVLAAAAFAAWWWFGLDSESAMPGGRRRLWLSPRSAAAITGAAVITAAAVRGEPHWGGLLASLAGMAAAAGIVWMTRIGASAALGREALGFGDVTLMAMVGAWVGWQAAVLACVLAVFIGLVHGIVQLVRSADSELPFGPSRCLATAAVIVWWRPLWNAAGPQFARPGEMALVVAVVILLTAVTLWAWQWFRGRRTA